MPSLVQSKPSERKVKSTYHICALAIISAALLITPGHAEEKPVDHSKMNHGASTTKAGNEATTKVAPTPNSAMKEQPKNTEK